MKLFRNYKNLSDEDLVNLLRGGNEVAFEEIYRRYFGKLVRYISFLLNNQKEAAEDLVQDVFVWMIHENTAFDSGRKFSPWIYKICTNKAKNFIRDTENRKRINEKLNTDEIYTPLTDFSIMDAAIVLEKVKLELQEFSADHQSTFLLRFLEEMSIKEIAVIMDCSEGTVKSRIFYTLKHLNEKLKIYSETYFE